MAMAEHRAIVTVNASVHHVYELFSHFNDYPKFMTYVKEVTYIDQERSHWVVDIVGTHAWDAVNVDWVADARIGWRSTDGLENRGLVTFDPLGPESTLLSATIHYEPPAGVLGQLAEILGAGGLFERRLQSDLDHFAQMVEHAPTGALDPASSAFLFHGASAAAAGRTTRAQDRTMGIPIDFPSGSTLEPASTSVTSASHAPDDPGVPRIPGTSRQIDTL
jgi:uncharacterized membrane protein